MSPDLVLPAAIEAVIQSFVHSNVSFTVLDVQQALGKARGSLENPTEAESFGAWVEVLAFAFLDGRSYMGPSPWGTFFCPMGATTDKEGNTVYLPDIYDADNRVIAHWTDRANTVTHPVLKARYADLVWDMCVVIAKTRRDPKMARLAIDAYLASISVAVLSDIHERFVAVLRALDLASLIRDTERIELSRAALLQLHREVMNERPGPWWFAIDRLT